MGATNNIFHGKRRSLFLGILFSSFWSIFLLFRQFSFFLILIQHRYMCSMCCVGLQSDVFICIFRLGSKYIHVLSVLRWLAVKEAVTRRQITDPRRFFTPADHTIANPAEAIIGNLRDCSRNTRTGAAGLGEQFRSGIFQNRCLTTRRECSITPRQGAGALHKGAVWVAAALGLVCKKHH